MQSVVKSMTDPKKRKLCPSRNTEACGKPKGKRETTQYHETVLDNDYQTPATNYVSQNSV